MGKAYIEVALPGPWTETFTYLAPDDPIEIGDRVEVQFGRQDLSGWVTDKGESYEGPYTLKPIVKKVKGEPLFDKDYLELAHWMSKYYWSGIGEVLDSILPKAKRERDLDSIDQETVEANALGLEGDDPPQKTDYELSTEQKNALETLKAAKGGFWYIEGVTGSGKTEVFLQIARHLIEEQKSVIYLVPEISLTDQVISDIEKRFAGVVAVLHSRLTRSQKLGQWTRIARGEARIVVGARSAVFAPVKNLGLIIVDEEHETSYKSGSTPRYHARQVAMHRSQTQGAMVLMGSATPSVEAYHLMEEGVISRIRLTQRVSGGQFPKLEIEAIPQGGVLGKNLVTAINETLLAKKQVLLFLNRRGFSHFAFCRSCGSEDLCSHCSRPMTYHKSKEMMICHYCGRAHRPRPVCPKCKQKTMTFTGFGTEFIEEETKKLFPHARVERIDTDSVVKRDSLVKKLTDFREGRIDILLGTQMIAKGLNFRRLGLVGVVVGDSGLHLPDFRAAERTFSLLVQVAGRAGRFKSDGRVIIQAAQPEHPVLQLVQTLDSKTFYENEIEARRSLGFPPFTRLLRLVFRSKSQSSAQSSCAEVCHGLSNQAIKGLEIIGFSACPLELLNGNYRFHLLIAISQLKTVHGYLTQYFESLKLKSNVYLEIDLDPVSLF